MSESTDDSPVLLYDGSCGFCSATVQLVLRHDRLGTLRFAGLQSPFAKLTLRNHADLRGVDSLVCVDPTRGEVLTRSAAALQVAGYLGGVWRLALLLWIVPRRIRDWGYDFIARHRHLLAGGDAHCIVPSPDERHRFLEALPGPVRAVGSDARFSVFLTAPDVTFDPSPFHIRPIAKAMQRGASTTGR